MANAYTQVYIQAVLAVRDKACIISQVWRDELYKYITGIVRNNGHKLLAINGMPDHIHLLVRLRPIQSIAELLHAVKTYSAKWINENWFVRGKFTWQPGYGAFSYSAAEAPNVINYINEQEERHRGKTFMEEYLELLQEFAIAYDERFLFKPVEIEYFPPEEANEAQKLKSGKFDGFWLK